MVGSRWRRALGVLLAVPALALATACTAEPNASWRGGDGAPAGSSAPAGSGLLAITPATGTAGVPVLDPVTVTAQDATLQSVALTNEAGKQVTGEYDADKHSWHSTEPLGTGKTFGVGQPIVVWFDRPIIDKVAAEQSLQVITNPPVEGRWHWFDKQEVHWRPPHYWKPGTKVVVNAKVYGVKLGDGLYGEADRTASFTIGPSKIAVADSNTKHMLVYVNGALVRDVP